MAGGLRGPFALRCVEALRAAPFLQLFERSATEATSVVGYELAVGDRIAALGAAARDPAVFENSDTLDIGRSPNPHPGLGGGIHYCVGAPIYG